MKKRYVIPALAMSGVLALCAGCSDTTEELASYRAEGISEMEAGDYEAAIKSFEKALELSVSKLSDEELEICLLKAKAQYLSGDSEAALATYTSMIDYNQCPESYYFRGNLYYVLGDEESALSDYAKAIELDPEDYEIYINVYESLTAHNQTVLADQYIDEALKISGETAYDNMCKGRIYYLLGDETQALSYLLSADENGQEQAAFYLAIIYNDQGQEELAQSYLDKFLDSGEADADSLFVMGENALDNGQYEEAITYLNAALEMDASCNRQALLQDLVIAYEFSGDFTAARDLLTTYTEEYPNDDEAARELTFLESR